MIRIDNPAIYNSALALLSAFKGAAYLGRLVQIFLAAKYYGKSIPRVGDPTGIDVGTIQRLIDDLYEKPSLGTDRVSILFSNNHLAPTGVVGTGQTSTSNIWRNNFNIQKGFGCYAPPVDLLNPAFRNGSRTLCKYLAPATPGQLSGAHCSIDPQGAYRNEDHAKVFHIDTATRSIFIYDPNDMSFYRQFLVNSHGRRIPIAPLVVALYFDGIASAGRSAVDTSDFMYDFGFSASEFAAYFDDDPVAVENAQLAAAYPGMLTWTRIAAATTPPLGGIKAPAGKPPKASPPAAAANISPPAGSFWWDAEQAVRLLLENSGWTVTDNSRLNLGYDLLAHRPGETMLVEVKSSAGRCSPTLTPNEYAEARSSRQRYILALVEDYAPTKTLTVKWVRDPARLSFTQRSLTLFSLPRSQWVPNSTLKP